MNSPGRSTTRKAPAGRKLSGHFVFRARSDEPELPRVSAGTVVSWLSVDGIVRRELAGKFTSDAAIRFGDGSYYLPTKGEVEAILAVSGTNRKTYYAERFDCDDFAFAVKAEFGMVAYKSTAVGTNGLCAGIAWGLFKWISGKHAVNWFINADDEKLYFIEPKDDRILPASECAGEIELFVV